MRACIVCHKFIKQPQYCPKHDPKDDMKRLLNEILGIQAQNDPQGLFRGGISNQTLEMQLNLRAQQFGGGLGGQQFGADLGAFGGALGQTPPPIFIPAPSSGPDVAGWLKSLLLALSWILNPVTALGLKLGVLKRRSK